MADKYDFQEIGTSGLQQTGGWIIDEFIPDLRGIRGAKIYREMSDNDPVIGAMLFAIERLILNIDWDVEPYSDKNEIVKKKDEQNAQFLRECMHDMNESYATGSPAKSLSIPMASISSIVFLNL